MVGRVPRNPLLKGVRVHNQVRSRQESGKTPEPHV